MPVVQFLRHKNPDLHAWLVGGVHANASQGVRGVTVCELRVSVWGVCVFGVFHYVSVCIECTHVFIVQVT